MLPKGPLYTGTPSVFGDTEHIEKRNVLGHTLINRSHPFLVYSCACVEIYDLGLNLALRQILTWSSR